MTLVWLLDASAIISIKKTIPGNQQWRLFRRLEDLVLIGQVAFPKQVTMFLDAPLNVDLDKVKIELQQEAPPDAAKTQEAEDDIMKSFGGGKK